MYNLCVFAGTTEGRELISFLTEQPLSVTACVATEYGETLLHPAPNLTISAARLTREDMIALFTEQKFDLVVDATHPYAPIVTENIVGACAETNTQYLRLLREENGAPQDAVFVSDIAGAVRYLNTVTGNILLTTGSKELSSYTDIQNFTQRVYARVLPMEDSLRLCQGAGLPPAHILAMQGPFSQEMNVAMLKAVSAKFMVTKESGAKGGFAEKIAAARQAGAKLIVVGRPPQRQGKGYRETLEYLCRRFDLRRKPIVTVAGIGPGNQKAMTGEVLTAISQADCVIGAKRMLEAVTDEGKCRYDAISPEAIARYIHTNPQHQRFVVVMSGDVGFYSGTRKLLPLLHDCKVNILPGLSSLSYLCARLGTSYEDVFATSIHGREHDILTDVMTHNRVFALVGGENGIAALCKRLVNAGFADAKISVGERLSYPDETITLGTAETLSSRSFASLSAALIEHDAEMQALPCGLPDEAFQRGAGSDGVVPMTKSEVRCVCLSKLRLTNTSVCWDVGAGTGSVSIEAALQARRGQVFAIEKKEAAVELMGQNCQRFGVENVTIVPGTAPEVCKELPAPSHAFIGGSTGNMRSILSLLLEKNPNVRIVATAVTLESVGELTACMKEFPFTKTEVISMSVARDRKAGAYHLMTGQNPIYIFTMEAGGEQR